MKPTATLVTALAALATATITAPSASAQERETYESRTLGPIFQNLLRMVPEEGIIISAADGWEALRVTYLIGSERMEFSARSGYEYTAWGWSAEGDIDICVYDPDGERVSCDTLSNSRPVVTFTTRGLEEGMYAAVLEEVSGDVEYAGMMITRKPDTGAANSSRTRQVMSMSYSCHE